MPKSSEYWARRYKLIEQACHDISLEYLEEMEKKYRNAEQTIQAKINAWYGRFAVNNNISMSEARKWLNDKELDELKWNVEQYIKYGKQNAIDGKWEKELENASAKFHISRLEALRLECRQQIEQLTGGMTDDVDSVMQDTYREGYYRSMYEVQKGVSVGFDVAALDKNLVKRIVNKPWHIDGSDFSSSIWSNKAKLLGTLDKEISKMVLTGSSLEKTIRAIQQQLNVSKSNAQRLVLTESAYFTTRAQADSYSELGVELYEVVATLDKRTCDVCGSFDGKKYPLSEMEVGVNAPPFHPRCRCTTCPYDEDSDVFGVGTRAARDENGKTVSVPGDMTFEDWKKTFVDGDKNDTIEKSDNSVILKSRNTTILSKEKVVEKAKVFGDELLKHPELIEYDNGNPISNYVNKKLGYDALPKVVSSEEFENLSAGKTILYRGVTDSNGISSSEMVEQFKRGKFYCGTGVYGNGTYADIDRSVAEYYAYDSGVTGIGEVMEMILTDDAKTISFTDIYTEFEKTGIPKIIGDAPEAYQDVIRNVGTYASIKGYDAITLDGFQKKNHIVILNRGKVIVKE